MDDSDWLGGFETDRSADRAKAERLANVLHRLAGSREHKVDWLTRHIAIFEAEVVKAGHEPGTRAFGAAIVAISFRWYRRHAEEMKRAGRSVGERAPADVVKLADRIGK